MSASYAQIERGLHQIVTRPLSWAVYLTWLGVVACAVATRGGVRWIRRRRVVRRAK